MASKKADPYSSPLDKEEKDLLAFYEKDEWESVSNLPKETAIAKKAACNYLRRIGIYHKYIMAEFVR